MVAQGSEFNRIQSGNLGENNDSCEEANPGYPRVYGNRFTCFFAED